MERIYSIDEILTAVDEIKNKKKEKKDKALSPHLIKKNYSEVPKHTLQLIEEAEDIK